MTTTEQTIKQISDAPPLVDDRDCRGMSPGEWARQGDVYVQRLADGHKPTGKRTTERQAAPGTTQGSRHVIEGKVTIYAPAGPDPLVGPVVVAREDWWLRHPEHADMQFPPGVFQIRYQRDFAREEVARVAD